MLRLLDQPESRYDAVWILTIPAGEAPARALAGQIQAMGPKAAVHVVDPRRKLVAILDPQDIDGIVSAARLAAGKTVHAAAD